MAAEECLVGLFGKTGLQGHSLSCSPQEVLCAYQLRNIQSQYTFKYDGDHSFISSCPLVCVAFQKSPVGPLLMFSVDKLGMEFSWAEAVYLTVRLAWAIKGETPTVFWASCEQHLVGPLHETGLQVYINLPDLFQQGSSS